MARRFGRNRKRALQEKIKTLEGEVEALEVTLGWEKGESTFARWVVRTIAEKAGKGFALTPPQMLAVQTAVPEIYFAKRQPAPLASIQDPLRHSFERGVAEVINTEAFYLDYADAYHVNVQIGRGSRVRYAVSGSFLRGLTQKEREEFLQFCLAPQIIREVSKSFEGEKVDSTRRYY